MSSSGAKAALEGYRKQALYTLACILHQDGQNLIFQPEGTEDLAVFRGQHLLRTIQVKAYSGNLTLSSFTPEKPRSFFHRVTDHAADDDLEIEVVSFGQIGAEIEGAWSGDEQHCASVRTKLLGHKFSDAQIDTIFNRLQWKKVDEESLQRQFFDFLRDSAAGGDPETAFDLLTIWIYFAAEKKQRIIYSELIAKINAIGTYNAERSARHQEWGNSIIPIEDTPVDSSRNEQLAKEFYNGISTRYSHILAGFDVPRHDRLNAIEQAFASDAHTVIIHGASGQGKTTLALRFLHDYVPEHWRYSIRYMQDKNQIARVANALAGQLRVVNAPLYLHLDVSPRDHEWPELVKNLLDEKNIRILITIREEDLARNTVSDTELDFPKTIPLVFNESEARTIYGRLLEQGVTASFPSFDDAWVRFGGDGPLLEFVYFITQAESLKNRLHNQVLRLREEVRTNKLFPEEFAFMRVCSVASAFEARIDAASLAAELKLKDPVRTLQLLDEEYLLRSSHDRRHVEALHPIRSEILAHELTDPVFEPWREAAQLAIYHMPEPDLEAFLLYAFARRPEDVEFLVAAIYRYCPKTWSGVAAIMRALIWLGVKEYVDANMPLIVEARTLFTQAWYMALKFDISGISSDGDAGLLGAFKLLEFSAVDTVENLRLKQTDRHTVFIRLTAWINDSDSKPHAPQTVSDWSGFAEAHFWIRHLKLETTMTDSVALLDLSWPLEQLSFRGFGEVLLSLSYAPEAVYQKVIKPLQRHIMERFCAETKTIAIEETNEMVCAHYLVPMESPENSTDKKNQNQTGDRLETEAIKLLGLLRMYAPDRKAYGVQGYGHNLRFIPMPFDRTAKGPVESRYLPPEWPVKINAIFRNLGDLHFRSATWQEYAEATVEIREQVIMALNALVKALTAYFAGNRAEILSRKLPQELWSESNKAVNQNLSLPRIAVDEWGLVGEGGGTSENESAVKTRKDQSIALVLQAYQPYLKTKNEYFSSLGNYFNQSAQSLIINSAIGRMKTNYEREQYLRRVSELGYKPNTDRLSLHNLGDALKALAGFQQTFHELLSVFIATERLHKLESRERNVFTTAWALWYQFVYHPENKWDSADVRAVAAFDRAQSKMMDNIKRRLNTLPDSGWSGSIISEAALWEGWPSLWFRLDAENSLAIIEAYQKLVQMLEEAFAPMDIRTLKHYVLDLKWPHILIVPFVAGEYLQNGVWHLSSCLFWGGEKVLDPEKTWLFMPREVDSEVLQQLGIESVEPITPGKIQLLQQAASELLVYVDHLADLRKTPDNLDEIGMAILQKHVVLKAQEASEALTRLIEQMQVLLDEVNAGVFDSSPHADEIRVLLVNIWKCVMPDGNTENTYEIKLSDCDQWAEKLLEGLGHMTMLNHFYLHF
ncbi:MAG: hypothetical protein A2X79_02005 [Desulfuromonadaceae bacterium GWB2_53_15]|nr:MAG: hypothetical protein A2X79_02005 [Desulfuromonadaceae bacterium GWB2_53_15]